MNFVHIGFVIAGAAAMSLPIWIHLLLRQRAQPISIGSLRFVKHVVRKTKSRQRIQRWLLLALRALAVLILGFLFARPWLTDTPIDGRTREVVVLIDRSASMSATHSDGTTAMQRAIQGAQEFVSEMGDQANLHLAVFDAAGVESVSLTDLSQVEPTATATRYDDGLAWASDLLDASKRVDRSMLILSDLQREGLNASDIPSFPSDVPVRVVDPGPGVTQNLAIDRVAATQVELRPGVPISLSIRLYNAGAFPAKQVPVSLRLQGPGGSIEMEQEVALEAGRRTSIDLNLDIEEPGIYKGEVIINRDDPLEYDNRRYFAFEARHPDRLLLVDGDPGRKPWENSTYFLETALRLQTPVGDGPPRTFEVERLVWDQGAGFPDLAGFRLIVLANLGRFTERDLERTKEFVRAGGNVLWFFGERTGPSVLERLQGSNLLGDMRFGPATDTLARVSDFDESHPALRPFANPQHGDLRQMMIRRVVPMESLGEETDILVRSRRWPLVVSQAFGQGKVVVVATSADRSWSDWPQDRLFVPLVRQLAAWLTGQLDSRQLVENQLIDKASEVPGITTDGDFVRVQNVAPSESETVKLTVDQFREAVGLPENSIKNEDDEVLAKFTPLTAARSDEMWPIFVWGLLGILGLELLLASRVHE